MTDTEGDIIYIGRMDSQVKIQGFRVELLEIEFYARQFLKDTNVFATTFANSIDGNNEIGLVIEAEAFNSKELLDYMKTQLPAYMVPSRVVFQPEFPYNVNGKVDRNSLKRSFQVK